MTWHPRTWPRTQAVFTLICLSAVATEGYALFVKRNSTFSIAGDQVYEIPLSIGDRLREIAEFAAENTVWQAFQMRGEGMQSVRVRLTADTFSAARLRFTLWRGSPDLLEMTRAFEVDESMTLRPGRHVTRSVVHAWYPIAGVGCTARPGRRSASATAFDRGLPR
jgi:hypothetical protein